MHHLLAFSYIIFLLLLLSQAVTVIIRPADTNTNPDLPMSTLEALICTDLRPGRCCHPPPIQANVLLHPNAVWRVAQWSRLQPLDIAAVWQGQGCSGTPLETNHGPGSWRYPTQGSSPTPISGASYIRLPQSIPKDNQDSPALEIQGILGLITGGGQWVAGQVSDAMRRDFFAGVTMIDRGSKKRRRRGIVSAQKGLVYAQPPPGTVWPDLVVVNGTKYVQEASESLVYRSDDGLVLDIG